MPWIIGGAILAGGVVSGIASNMAADTQADAAGAASAGQERQYQQTRQDLQPWMQSGRTALSELNAGLGLQMPSGPNWDDYLLRYPDVAASSTYGSNPAGHYERFGRAEGRTVNMTNPSAQPHNLASGQLLKPFSLADFQQSPAYQFNLEQGMQAINKGANSRGNYYAPQTLQDLGKFQQGLASNEFQNAYNMYNQDQGNIYNRLYAQSGAGQNAAAQTGGFGANMANNVASNTMGAGNAQAAGQIGVGNAITGGLQNAYNAYLTNQILSRNQQSQYGSVDPRGLP